MKIIEMVQAEKIKEATKRMVASLDPALAEKLELKEGTMQPYLELPGCFYILLGTFNIHRVFYYPPSGGDVVEVLCTRRLPSDKAEQRMTVAEMLAEMRTSKYLWLPRDSEGRRPNSDWQDEECAHETFPAKPLLNLTPSSTPQK